MEDKIFKEIALENNQTLVLQDMSRKIGEDAYVVKMQANIEIKIEKELFCFEPLSESEFGDILSTLGDTVNYEYKAERNFIMAQEKEKVFEALVKAYLNNLGQYVAKSAFPGKFILKEYRDKNK